MGKVSYIQGIRIVITLDKKLTAAISFLLFASASAQAIECPPGFEWRRMSGVGCVQKDCVSVGGSYGYTSNCFCRDKRSCYEPVDYEFFDGGKCHPNCPYSRLVGCVEPGEKCPHEIMQEIADAAAGDGVDFEAYSDLERDERFCLTKCKNEWGQNAVWDGQSTVEHCHCRCDEGYHVSYEWFMHPEIGYNKQARCVADDCKAYCDDLGQAYSYAGGRHTGVDCECSCQGGYVENLRFGFCVPIDETIAFPSDEICHPTTEDFLLDPFGHVCSCKAGLANCDSNNANGCETNTDSDRLNCGACGRICPSGRICSQGFCWDGEFLDAIARVDQDNFETMQVMGQIRDEGGYREILSELEIEYIKNQLEFMWAKTGDLFEGGTMPSGVFSAVGFYLDFIKKPGEHLKLRDEIGILLAEAKIDAGQAEMIKNLDAVLKASSVLSGKSGVDAVYAQSVIIDTAAGMVIDEALRSAKYSYCRDIIARYGANPQDAMEKAAVDQCLERHVSAGIFK